MAELARNPVPADEAGVSAAVARLVYDADKTDVRHFNAWLIGAAGSSRDYTSQVTVDVPLSDGSLYNESRVRYIDATGETTPGDVFGYDFLTEETALFPQLVYQLKPGNRRLTIRLPGPTIGPNTNWEKV